MTSVIRGRGGDDNLSGTSGDDEFLMFQGGNDTVHGGDGNDVFRFGATLTAADHIDGGNDHDTVILKGFYGGGLTFAADTMVNVETLSLIGAFDYMLTTNDATVAAGATLTVKANGVVGGHALTFDGSAETDGHFRFVGSGGDDMLTGGGRSDLFNLSNGGNDTAFGGGGNDVFELGAMLTPIDQIDGGAGRDTLELDGTYNMALNATTITNIETIKLLGAHNYEFTSVDGNVAAGATLTIDSSALAGPVVFWDGSAETDGAFHFIAGVVTSYFQGGAGNDVFDLSQGNDGPLGESGGAGNDTFNVGANLFNYYNGHLLGGSGDDTLNIDGTYVGNIGMGAAVQLGIDRVHFGAGHSYTASIGGDIADSTLTVDGSALGAGDTLSIDLSTATSVGYTVTGGAGNDTVKFGSNFSPAYIIDGGAGNDTLELNGDYHNTVVLGATTLSHIETVKFDAGNSYDFRSDDGNVAAGATLTIDASATNIFVAWDGQAETDGAFHFISGTGQFEFDGGAGNDVFDLTTGLQPNVLPTTGGGGDDTFNVGANYIPGRFNGGLYGGSGDDTLNIDGAYAGTLILGSHELGIDTVHFGAGHSYTATIVANFADSALTVDGSALGAGDTLTLDFNFASASPYIVKGGAGDDTILFAGSFSVIDVVDGGAGNNTLELDGAYTIALGATSMANIQTVKLDNGNSYDITGNDGNVAAGATLTIDASAVAAFAGWNGIAETDGAFHFIAGSGTNKFVGGDGNDVFDLTQGHEGAFSPESGNGGDDTFDVGANFASYAGGGGIPGIFGGSGNDTLDIDGAYAGGISASDANLSGIDTVKFAAGHSYTVAFSGDFSDAGLTVDASALSASNTLSLDLSAGTSASYTVTGGAGNDSFVLSSSGVNTVTGGLGADTITFGSAVGIVAANAVADSTGEHGFDTLIGVNFDTDKFDLAGAHLIGAINFGAGAVNAGSLDSDIANAGNLGAGAALLVVVTGGDYVGHVFLAVDGNGDTLYEAGSDYLFDVTAFSGSLDPGDFI
jgi:hypothetical protein